MTKVLEGLAQTQDAVNLVLEQHLKRLKKCPQRLLEAAHYSLLGGGKRLRAYLTLITGRLVGLPESQCLQVAAAIEMVHAYTLIHDDLPIMDNSDQRRGQPATHLAFDEATALLAGNSLLTLAFDILSHDSCHPDPLVRLGLIQRLSVVSGFQGMMAGQWRDIHEIPNTIEDLIVTETLKTADFISYAIEAPLAMAYQNLTNHPLLALGQTLGLVYQMMDDVLDAQGNAITLGKPTGQDRTNHTKTFIDFYSVKDIEHQAKQKLDHALANIPDALNPHNLWQQIADFLIRRPY